MANLDDILSSSRSHANDLERQERMLGAYLDDPLIQATHKGVEAVGSAFKKAKEFIAPAAEKAKTTITEDVVKPVAKILSDPRMEAVGLGVTTGGAATGQPEVLLPGLAILGMAKTGKLIRDRFNVEEIVQRALEPSPLAERVTSVLNEKTAVLPDAVAKQKADALVQSGGVTRETLTKYAPETALASAPQALAVQEVLTQESRAFIDTAKVALERNDPQMAEQAVAQFARLLDPASRYAGAVTTTAQTLRVASNADIKALNLLLERSSKTAKGDSALDTLKTILADPATDPAAQGKSLTQSFRNVMTQAKEVVATGDQAGAEVLLHEIQAVVEEEAQLGLFATEQEVKKAQAVQKSVTAQHIVEANQAAAKAGEDQFKLTPTGPGPVTPKQTTFLEKPIKPGDQLTDDQLREFNERLAKEKQDTLTHSTAPGSKQTQGKLFAEPIKPGQQITDDQIREYNRLVAVAQEEKLKLTRVGAPGAKAGKQEDFVKQDEQNRLATIREHQAQDLRASTGTSVFSPKRETFKLTPPTGGARTRAPKQLDLLNIIAKEPEPEQLALEMAAAIEHPELSTQFLKLIKGASKAIELGSTEDVGKALSKIQAIFREKTVDPNKVTQPTRLVTAEKKALQAFFQRPGNKDLGPEEMLKALLADPDLQPEALVAAINQAKNPTWRGAMQYVVINGMLGPTSDMVNLVATASMLPVHLAARTVGARIGQVSRLLGGKAGVIVGEDEAMLHGLYSSFWDSIKLAGRVAKTHVPEIGPNALKETAMGENPLSGMAMFHYSPTARKLAGITKPSDAASSPALSRAGFVSRAIDVMGVTLGLPGRLMLSGDQFIQNMAMAAEQHAIVYRRAAQQAVREGLTEQQFYESYKPLWRDVSTKLPEEIRKSGEQFSLEVSLNQKLGTLGQSVLNLREVADQRTGLLGTISMPFFKTLVNSSKATWELTPLAPVSHAIGAMGQKASGETLQLIAKELKSDMFGADPVKRDIALGKWAVGTMMMSGLLYAAINGRLRGRGPDNKELRQQDIEAHGLTDSVVVNADDGTSVQINRFGIVGNLAGMAADVAEVWMQADEHTKSDIAQLLTTAYVGNLSFDFLQNSSGIIHALANGVKTKADLDLIAKSTTSLIPLGATARSVEKILATPEDPLLMKDAKTALEKILARFPGYDSLAEKYGLPAVPVLRNQFGYAVRQPTSAWGTEWFNPIFVSRPSKDATLREIAEIELSLGVAIQQPRRDIGKHNLELNNEEYAEYQKLAGAQWEQRAAALLPMLRRDDIPDQVKRDKIEMQVREARAVAARQLFGVDPELASALGEQTRVLGTTLRTPKKYVRP